MLRFVVGVLCATTSLVTIGSLDAASTETVAVKVVDGDTIDARVLGKVQRVRMLGVNSTEPGTCHATEAREWLEQRIEGRRVTLSARDPNVTLGFGRPARFVDLDGRDIGAEMIELGLVIPYPHVTETARNDKYVAAAARAKSRGIGIWDDDACGQGPSQSSGLRLLVRWDAPGDDSINVNGEWIDVFNPSDSTVDLSGWTLRDASTRSYHFPAGSTVRPGRRVRVHIGKGVDTGAHLYWGRDRPVFSNHLDEAAYLFDPDGDLRASFEYPCRLGCVNEFTSLTLDVNADAFGSDHANPNGEWIDIINRSGEPVSLYGTYLSIDPIAYYFEPRHSVPPHGRLRISIGPGSDTSTKLFLGEPHGVLRNEGATITLNRADGPVLEEFTYPLPGASCTRTPGPDEPASATARSTPVMEEIGRSGAAVAAAARIGARCR